MNTPLPADFMFTFNPGGVLSEGIAFFTHMKISHAQMIMDVGANGTLQVVSAEAEGLIDKWVIPETVPWYCILRYYDMDLKKRDDIARWMWDKRGTPYDVWGLASFIVNIDLNNEKKSFCSEVCFQAYEANGIILYEGIDHAYVHPGLLYINPLLKTLDGSRKEVR